MAWLLVCAATLLIPLAICVTCKDNFRLPKELLFRGTSIALLATALVHLFLFGREFLQTRLPRRAVVIAAAVMSWSATTALLSTNRALSALSLAYAASALVFALATYGAALKRPVTIVWLPIVPALVNAVVAILQRFSIWSPVEVDATGRLATTALVGNPDDLGMLLVGPALAATVLAVTCRRQRMAASACALTLFAGLAASETIGALVAVMAGLFLLFVFLRPRAAVTLTVICALAGAAFIRMSPTRWTVTRVKLTAAAHGDIDPLLSGRLPAFLGAWRMFREHPVAGVGPGCFKFRYFDEKIAVEREHPWLLNRSVLNFGEAHNEHLQLLAEGGIPAYVAFLAALGLLAWPPRKKLGPDADERLAFAARLGLPLATAIFVLGLSAFPLRLAAPTQNLLFFSALTLAWSRDDAPP